MRNLLVLSFLMFTALTMTVQAEDEQKTKKTVAMSQQVYESLQKAQEMVEADEWTKAHSELAKLRTRKGLSEYELAQIWNLEAYTYYQEENYPQAIRSYENLLAQGKDDELPEALVQSTLKTMAQLYFTTEEYGKALTTVKQLMAQLEDPAADVYMLLGQAYFQQGDFDRALGPITTAIGKYKEQGRTPKENWLLILRVIHYEKKDYAKMADVLKELIRYYPRDKYILTLAAAYSELGQTKKQLVLTEALYESGFLTTSNHLVNMANLYLLHEIPYKAAVLLDKELKAGRIETTARHLRLLSQAWYQAREDDKAIPPLRRAAELSQDGELFVRLAQSHINLEQWDEAVVAVREGLRLGGVKRPDTANVMLGMALFNQKKFSASRNAFREALADSRSERAARQWIKHVDQEIERRETLNQEIKTRDPIEIDPLLRDNAGLPEDSSD